MLGSMIGVPELADYEKVLPRAYSFVEGAFDSIADLFLIAVVTRVVQQTIAVFDRLVDDFSTDILWHFPKAKTQLWQSVATVQWQRWH